MRSYTRWITPLLIAMFVLAVAGSATARQVRQKQRAAPVVKRTLLTPHTKASVSLIARVKTPKPVSRMSLAEVERFQTKALAHYTGMWHTWLTVVKPHYRSLEAFPASPQWQIKVCHGAVAPKWACWNLEARLWTRTNLLATRHRIEVIRLRTLPLTNDWFVATSLADRVYPGTKQWLLSCSGGEGGHGGFVMNHGGSGAGGWMQFMSSTYTAHNNTAFADARAKGFIVDEKANSWYHPLGQALTAAYLRTHGGSSNWNPAEDSACA